MSFDAWFDAVDREIVAICGLGVNDLPDQPYRDWYNDEMPPREAAMYALEDSGAPDELLAF